MTASLTPWFPSDVKPFHVGVYETMPGTDTSYQFWNGRAWACCSSDVRRASEVRDLRSRLQHNAWRGLSEKPK